MYSELTSALQRVRDGGMVILVDEDDRENEGDLVLAAEHVSAEAMNFMLDHARGLLTVPMTEDRLRELDIRLLEPRFGDAVTPRFTEPVDCRHDVTTGCSVSDRVQTIRWLLHPGAQPQDFVRPGHVFPLAEAPGGLSERRGHTECAVALMRLAGCQPAALLAEILRADGEMAREQDWQQMSVQFDIPIIHVGQIIDAAARETVGPAG